MKLKPSLPIALLTVACVSLAHADERRFTYTYEPEVLPKGAMEFEQWVTLRTQRTKGGSVQKGNYNRWDFSEELEYGVTDRYTASLYLNFTTKSFKDYSVAPPVSSSEFEFAGVALENRYMVINPANHAVGLTLYFEPRFSGSEAELEQKIIIGQRHGDWKWAFNVSHASEWENDLHKLEGEMDFTLGISRDMSSRWSLGMELRNHNAFPDYKRWEYTSFYAGPAINYRQEKWWATLSVLPQVFGRNFLAGSNDNHSNLVLDEQERVHIRLIFGIDF